MWQPVLCDRVTVYCGNTYGIMSSDIIPPGWASAAHGECHVRGTSIWYSEKNLAETISEITW